MLDATELDSQLLATRFVLAQPALPAVEKASCSVRDVALGVLHCGLISVVGPGFPAGQQGPRKALMDPK
ncbi:MAG: hypothetical protein QOH34_2665 [Mycobacterium sp.]|jgi:hypothetical protein|nr:hypothetical protein [Mycobacterium sp.]